MAKRRSAITLLVAAGLLIGSTAASPLVHAGSDGRVFSWGLGNYGQLGNGVSGDGYKVSSPVSADDTNFEGRTVAQVAAGYEHSCAIAEGKAYCWGSTYIGSLGGGFPTYSPIPVPVPVDTTGALQGKTVTDITAGRHHTCVVADGEAYCWGSNPFGLGHASITESLVPVAVDTTGVLQGKTVTDISANGGDSTCAIADGQAYCWGSNFDGNLGDGSTTNRTVPVAVKTTAAWKDKTVTHISAGPRVSCAVADEQAYCWGYNLDGNLGDGSTTSSTVPVAVDTTGALKSKAVTDISVGYFHVCAVASGQAFCWGNNSDGNLGNGSTTNSTVPVAVDTTGPLTGKAVRDITANGASPTGGNYSCAVADGMAACWGVNSWGQLGDSSLTRSKVPVTVEPVAFGGVPVGQVAAGGSHAVVALARVPDAPRNATATAADASAVISWSPPVSDGGSPVTTYRVTAHTGQRLTSVGCSTAGALTCEVTGLANGTSYTFDVVAANGAGDSQATTTNAVTPAAAPSPDPTSSPEPTLSPEPSPTPTPAPVPVQGQAQKPAGRSGRAPRAIRAEGITRITGRNARTNAGQPIRTRVRCLPNNPQVAGETRYCTVIRGPGGAVSLRTYGKEHVTVIVVQSAAATDTFRAYRRRTVYIDGVRQ